MSNRPRIGFGLDLAGFSRHRGTAIVAIGVHKSLATLTILTDSPFSKRLKGTDNFPARIRSETQALAQILELGNVAVDVPIDLQGLPKSKVMKPWELTLRPVDRAIGGLPPLASLLGACVSRFRAILTDPLKNLLGERLFETYPAASLRQSGLVANGYKTNAEQLAGLCRTLEIRQPCFSHDEFDAAICAFAAISSSETVIEGPALLEMIKTKLGSEFASYMKPAKGYRILAKRPKFASVLVERKSFDEWIQEQKSITSSSPA